MKRLVLILSLALAAPAAAQQDDGEERGLSLMERGAQLFFRGLMSEMEPALKELGELAGELEPALRSFAREMGPALADILREIEDFSAYHPPEILPNGDIIIRKKTPEERAQPDQGADGGQDIEI